LGLRRSKYDYLQCEFRRKVHEEKWLNGCSECTLDRLGADPVVAKTNGKWFGIGQSLTNTAGGLNAV